MATEQMAPSWPTPGNLYRTHYLCDLGSWVLGSKPQCPHRKGSSGKTVYLMGM